MTSAPVTQIVALTFLQKFRSYYSLYRKDKNKEN